MSDLKISDVINELSKKYNNLCNEAKVVSEKINALEEIVNSLSDDFFKGFRAEVETYWLDEKKNDSLKEITDNPKEINYLPFTRWQLLTKEIMIVLLDWEYPLTASEIAKIIKNKGIEFTYKALPSSIQSVLRANKLVKKIPIGKQKAYWILKSKYKQYMKGQEHFAKKDIKEITNG